MSINNRIRHLPFKVIQAVRYQYGSLFGHTNYSRFAIVGNARTGSNFLLDGIISSGSVYMYHEIFADHNRTIGKDFDKIIAKLYSKKERHINQVGVKIFYYHLSDDEWEKFLKHDEIKIIHLIRKNRLRTVISLEIALKTNEWVATPTSRNDSKDKSIRIDPDKLVEQLTKIGENEARTRERFMGRQFLEVTYEDITKNPNEEFRKLGSFLNISNINPDAIRHKKQNPEGLRELITNYDEVEKALIGTPHEIYLK